MRVRTLLIVTAIVSMAIGAVVLYLVLTVPTAYSLGFIRPSKNFRFGSSDRAFGHPGAGGSFAFADPDLRVAFAYAPNKLGHHLRDDPREKSLRDALYLCIERGAGSGDRLAEQAGAP